MQPGGTELDVILGLLSKVMRSKREVSRQLIAFHDTYLEVEKDAQNEKAIDRQGKGGATNANLAKGSVYLRLAMKEVGGENAWNALPDKTKVSVYPIV